MEYDYPGNIPELENAIMHACLREEGTLITLSSLPGQFIHLTASRKETDPHTDLDTGPISLKAEMERLERKLILKAIDKAGGNKTKAAELLGINFRSLRYRLQKLKIE